MAERITEKVLLDDYRQRAEELGITLQEYLQLKILMKLDDLTITTYIYD